MLKIIQFQLFYFACVLCIYICIYVCKHKHFFKEPISILKNTNEHVQLRVFEYVFHKFCGGKKGVEFCENKVRLIYMSEKNLLLYKLQRNPLNQKFQWAKLVELQLVISIDLLLPESHNCLFVPYNLIRLNKMVNIIVDNRDERDCI